MEGYQQLYPQVIYRFNKILEEILQPKGFTIIPTIFDRYHRMFNYIGIYQNRWKFEQEEIEKVIKLIKDKKNDWNNFIKKLDGEIKEVKEALDFFEDILKQNNYDISNQEFQKNFHFHLLYLYASYPIDKYIDGIIYDRLKEIIKDKGKISHVIGKLNPSTGSHSLVDYTILNDSNQELKKENNIDQLTLKPQINGRRQSNENPNEDEFFLQYIVPIVFYEDAGFDKYYALRQIDLNFITIPLYDAYINKEYYGNFYGNIHVFYENSSPLTLNHITPYIHLFSQEMEKAAIHNILEQEMKTDILEHFIKYLPMLQDWERVMVWKKVNGGENKFEIEYCYKRDDFGRWVQCSQQNDKHCKSNYDQLKKWIRDNQKKHISPLDERVISLKHCKRKFLLEEVFNEHYIPALYPDDIEKYRDRRLIYEYPSYTIFPEDESTTHKLGYFYERQQIDLLRQIALQQKVKRETIRHGTRAAVAAIDVRNLSHNIGSHVLSYWGNLFSDINYKKEESTRTHKNGNSQKANEIDQEIEKLQKYAAEKSGALFTYLRQRMDFIADLITTTPSWEKTFPLRDIIEAFKNQEVLLDNIAKSEGFCYAKECKKKILSKDDRWQQCIKDGQSCPKLNKGNIGHEDQPEPLEIEYEPKGDFYVSIPHGTTGIHAFFSILENFIRNSAKHGGESLKKQIKQHGGQNKKDSLKITISIEDDPSSSGDYLKVTIKDNVGNCKDVIEEIKKGIDPSNEESRYINDDGSIRKGRWGIKEMKLAANFLRKRSAEMIEDLDEDVKSYPLLSLFCDKECDNECESNVNYKLYLRNPKEIFIVKDKMENGLDYQSLKKIGIDIDTFDSIKKALEQGNSIPHRFLLFDSKNKINEISEFIKPHREKLPFRIIINGVTNTKIAPSHNHKDKWLNPVCANLSINYSSLASAPWNFIAELYRTFVKDKIGEKEILIRNDRELSWENSNICKVKRKIGNSDFDKIIFDDHFEGKDNLNGYKNFYQGLSGGINPTLKGLILKPPSEQKRDIVLYELIEAAMVKVLIADERIWKNSQGYLYGIPKLKFLEKMNIDCIEVKGGTIKIDDLENKKDSTILVIHYGLFEKMSQGDKNKFKGWYQENCPYIVIDSGRGVPHELIEGARFIPISALEQFIEEMDKYALVQTLFSLRRPKDV